MGKPSGVFWIVAIVALAANGLVATDSLLANAGEGGFLKIYTAEFVEWVETRPVWRVALQLTGAISGLIGSALLVFQRKEATATLSFAVILLTLGLAGDVLILDGLKHASVNDVAWSAALIAASAGFAWYAARAYSNSWLR
jgi:hypothetical protein